MEYVCAIVKYRHIQKIEAKGVFKDKNEGDDIRYFETVMVNNKGGVSLKLNRYWVNVFVAVLFL
jgi:hypothetical protein